MGGMWEDGHRANDRTQTPSTSGGEKEEGYHKDFKEGTVRERERARTQGQQVTSQMARGTLQEIGKAIVGGPTGHGT